MQSRLPGRGFTLIETMTVLIVLAVIATLATPDFLAWQMRDRVDTRARTLLTALSLARSEALRRGAQVTVCRIDMARRCLAAGQPCRSATADWSCGWAVYVERAGTSTRLRVMSDVPTVSVSGTQTALTFTPPAGQLIGSFRSFDIGPRTPTGTISGSAWHRCIRIAAGGRARMTEGACSTSA